MPLGYLDNHSKGERRNTLIDGIETLEDGMVHLIPEVGAAIFAPLIALVAMFVIDWQLALLVMPPLASGMFLLGYMMKNRERATRNFFDVQARMSSGAAEIADNLPTVFSSPRRSHDNAEAT